MNDVTLVMCKLFISMPSLSTMTPRFKEFFTGRDMHYDSQVRNRSIEVLFNTDMHSMIQFNYNQD